MTPQEQAHLHELATARGQELAFLNRIIPMLQDATDFLNLNPPRIAVPLERIDMIRSMIQKEQQRLRSLL